jgi:glutathione synthase
MRIGFVVNDIAGESPDYTTTLLAREALERGHEVAYVALDAFSLGPDDRVAAHALRAPREAAGSGEALLAALREAAPTRLALDAFDVVMLRNDPAEDVSERPWARLAGIDFGRFSAEACVIALNDPDGLARNLDKLALEHYPAEIRPRSLVSRRVDEIRAFAEEIDGAVVIKPLAGSGGRKVFLVRPDERGNLKQMIEAILEDGYVLAQEALPEAARGDVRLFLMNGRVLEVDGRPAALHRIPAAGEARANITQGAGVEPAALDDDMRRIADLVRPRLVADGLFLVGLDIAGAKLLEVNVFSPGGLGHLPARGGRDATAAIVEAIERKVAIERRGHWPNALMNTL